MDVRLTWTDCDEAGDYVKPNVLSSRDLVSRSDNMDETVLHTAYKDKPNGIPIYLWTVTILTLYSSFLTLARLTVVGWVFKSLPISIQQALVCAV